LPRGRLTLVDSYVCYLRKIWNLEHRWFPDGGRNSREFSGRISKRADGVGGRKEGKSVAERVLGVEVLRVVNYEATCPKIWIRQRDFVKNSRYGLLRPDGQV